MKIWLVLAVYIVDGVRFTLLDAKSSPVKPVGLGKNARLEIAQKVEV